MAEISGKTVVKIVFISALVYSIADWVINTGGPVDTSGPCQVTFIDNQNSNEDFQEDYVDLLGYREDSSSTSPIPVEDEDDGIIYLPPSAVENFEEESYYTKDAYTYAQEERALPLYNDETGQIDMKSPDLAVLDYYQEKVEDVEEKEAINDFEGVKSEAKATYMETTNFLFHNAPLSSYNITRSMITEETYMELLSDCVLIDSMAMKYGPNYKDDITSLNREDFNFYQEAIQEVEEPIIQRIGEQAYYTVQQNSGKGNYR